MKHLTLAKEFSSKSYKSNSKLLLTLFFMNEMSFSKSHPPFRTKLQLPNNLCKSALPHHYFWASIYIIIVLSCNSHISGDYLTLLCNYSRCDGCLIQMGIVFYIQNSLSLYTSRITLFFSLSQACLPYCFKGQLTRKVGDTSLSFQPNAHYGWLIP